MKVNEETTISEEQVLFNKLSYEEQQFILKQMRMLQPCELSCVEEKKIPEKLSDILRVNDLIPPVDENMYKIWEQTIKNQNKINEICDYLKSKGE